MEQTSSVENNRCSARRENPRVVCSMSVRYLIYKSLLLVRILCKMNYEPQQLIITYELSFRCL